MPGRPYILLGSRFVWRNAWYTLREDQLRLPDGSQGAYTVIERPGAVWIVPVAPDGRIILIRNYRHTVDEWLWEVPAGGLKPGVDPEEMARRELREEIGGSARSFEFVMRFYTVPGMSDEVGYIFLARGVTVGEPHREPTEVMEIHCFPLHAVVEMARQGEVKDGPSALAILLCAPRLEQNGR